MISINRKLIDEHLRLNGFVRKSKWSRLNPSLFHCYIYQHGSGEYWSLTAAAFSGQWLLEYSQPKKKEFIKDKTIN